MNLFGEHTFSFYSDKNERVWCKFHFKTRQGIKNLTNTEAEKINGMDEGVMKNYCPTKADVDFAAEHGLVHTDLFGKALEFLPVWKKACCRTLVDFSVFSGDPAFSCEDIFPNVDFAFLSTDSECGRDVAARIRRIQAQGPQLVVATMWRGA